MVSQYRGTEAYPSDPSPIRKAAVSRCSPPGCDRALTNRGK
ncbi:hypothetical protein [Myxacorys almedinensis]|nr:hypothetical protein [Myxacorys almedinensis]